MILCRTVLKSVDFSFSGVSLTLLLLPFDQLTVGTINNHDPGIQIEHFKACLPKNEVPNTSFDGFEKMKWNGLRTTYFCDLTVDWPDVSRLEYQQ